MMAEIEMQEADVPTFQDTAELADYIVGLVDRQHDYGTCVYAMSMAAVAAYNHVASKLGVTGFQASCADLDILRRVRRMEGPFMILNGERALYPQNDLIGSAREWLREDHTKKWLKAEAQKKLDELPSKDHAAPHVIEHWEILAGTAI